MKIEMSTIEADIDRYIDSLKKYAYSEMTSDIYSKSKLFNEKLFSIRNIESLDKLINRFNLPASGGERSEFNLIKTIEQAYGKDMLLIDEPESSFDNLFLNEDVNSLLKKISEDITVIIVTHNNTVGLSIKPDYIVYTLREIDNELKFHIYAGKPSSKKLYKSGYGTDYIKTEDVLVECLEAGQETYIDRSVYYGIYKNKR